MSMFPAPGPSARPLIGYVAGYNEHRPFFETPAAMLRAHGANLVFLAHTNDDGLIEEYAGMVDGVIIGGGIEDVAPARYGEEHGPELGPIDLVRDHFDLGLAKRCIARGLPLFGICRGVQVINVAFGGTLHQDIGSVDEAAGARHYGDWQGLDTYRAAPHLHHVRFERELFALMRVEGANVSSYHHQGIKDLGEDLVITARAPDGLAEAIEARGHGWVAGVQWHPELAQDEAVNRLLIAEFVRAAVERRERASARRRSKRAA